MVEISESDLKTSLGALILGGMVCTGYVLCFSTTKGTVLTSWALQRRLTGVVAMQTTLYFRLFTKDQFSTKLKVRR